MQIRVYYEDTDAGGIVYHSNYLNFCERARSEFFFQKGMLPVIDGAHFVVRRMECDFIKSAEFGDIIEVKTVVKEIKNSSLSIYQEILKDGELLFKTTVLLVLVDSGKVKRLTKEIKQSLQSLFN